MNTQTPESRRHLIKFFINKFEATEENEWCTGIRHNGLGQSCALGKTHRTDNWAHTEETTNLLAIRWDIAFVNNGKHEGYKQPTPRQRVLAALHDKLKECL